MAAHKESHSREPTRNLPERVGQLYYSHGLFCSSHPVLVISFAIAVVLLCCYPLLNLPLPGNVPQQLSGIPPHSYNSSKDGGDAQLPRWYTGRPLVYIQQVVLRTAVCPWTKDLVLTDAYRAPLAEVFRLLEVVRNYQHDNSSQTLSDQCLHIEAVKLKSDKKLLLPEYNCLVLSPANLWQQNQELFHEDPNLLSTIFSYQNLQKGKISLAEMLFGMNMKDTGIKRYPLRTRQRVVQYAVTIVLKIYDPEFLNGLKHKLTSLYPLHQLNGVLTEHQADVNKTTVVDADIPDVLHIYYPGEFSGRELVPLTVTFFILFLYMYFSVRKIELVKSKVGMAFSAVVTVLASLSMSVGLCFFFGLTLTLNGRQVFPYVVVIVGLENVLVLTKSVVSTPTHLDVKIRVAQGLSREGWSITKNLLTEVTILTVGLFTFVPAIQEFCIFAVVGLLSDFFLQMFFFSTVLAIDIHRMELSSDSHHHRVPYTPSTSYNPPLNRTPLRQFRSPTVGSSTVKLLPRSKSHPRLNGLSGISMTSNYPTNVVAAPFNAAPLLVKLPKRLRLVHFWARTRIFQRAFMVCMVVWISVIVYNSGVVQHMLQVTTLESQNPDVGSGASESDNQDYYVGAKSSDNSMSAADRTALLNSIADMKTLDAVMDMEGGGAVTAKSQSLLKQMKSEVDDVPRHPDSLDDLARLKHNRFDPWRRLSHHHWPAILSLYNISSAGQYVSILPAIRLSHTVSPEVARQMRNLEERTVQHFQWQALAAALDPLDFSDSENGKASSAEKFSSNYLGSDVPFVPSSPMELFLTSVLCIISVVVLAYTMVMLYRCVCSRNYAEWRASWAGEHEQAADGITQVVMEAVPLILDGHQQEVECLATDGSVVVSSCLGGQLRVWDSLSGESLATIDRKIYFSALQRSAMVLDIEGEDLPLSDYESGSPPSRGEAAGEDSHGFTPKTERSLWDLPDLRSAINTNFTSRSLPVQVPVNPSNSDTGKRKAGFDFGSIYQDLYREYRESLESDIEDGDNHVDVCKQSTSSNVQTFPRNSGAMQIPKHHRNASYGNLQTKYENICDTSSTSVQHRKTRNSWDMTDVSSDTSNTVSTSEHVSRSALTQPYSAPKRHSVDTDNILPENCDSYITDSSSSPHYSASTVFANVSHVRDKVVIPSGQAGKCHKTVCGEAACRDDSRMQQCVRLSTSGPATTSMLERGQLLGGGAQVPPVWCLDCHENLVVIGCANGRLEFWEGSVGKFKCLFEDGSGVGVVAVKIIGNRVVAAKLSGAIDFLELESYSSQGRPLDWGFTSYRRTHVRTGSAGSLSDWDSRICEDSLEEDIRCIRLNTTKAHQQPITVLDSEGGRVLTGSQDHTLKVFRLEDQLPLYTLHGHSGPISCLFIDRISPMMSGSGSQDGLLCVWDLLTGACMYSIQAHDGSVVALTYSASYVISLGADERLCVWERFQGHLLNTIQVAHTYCSSMVMLTHNLLITSKQGSLVVWDVRTGDPVRIVKLGHSDRCVFVKQILLLRDSIACDYSNQLRIVRFPLVTDKCD